MDSELILRIGAIGIRLAGDPGWQFSGQARFEQFISTGSAQASYNVITCPAPGKPLTRPYFEGGIRWRLYEAAGRWLLWVSTDGQPPYLVGNFASDYHSGEIYTSPSREEPGKLIFPLAYPMGELLLTNLLGTGYGILLHSCALIDHGNGIVFSGVGGAGKSTTSRLWNNLDSVKILNDDRSVIQKIDGEFRLFGTPWHGQGGFALAKDIPLQKIFILKHAVKNQAMRLAPAQALAQLLVRTFAPLWSAPAMSFTLQFLDELCQAIPCYELGFVPDQSAVEYVRLLA